MLGGGRLEREQRRGAFEGACLVVEAAEPEPHDGAEALGPLRRRRGGVEVDLEHAHQIVRAALGAVALLEPRRRPAPRRGGRPGERHHALEQRERLRPVGLGVEHLLDDLGRGLGVARAVEPEHGDARAQPLRRFALLRREIRGEQLDERAMAAEALVEPLQRAAHPGLGAHGVERLVVERRARRIRCEILGGERRVLEQLAARVPGGRAGDGFVVEREEIVPALREVVDELEPLEGPHRAGGEGDDAAEQGDDRLRLVEPLLVVVDGAAAHVLDRLGVVIGERRRGVSLGLAGRQIGDGPRRLRRADGRDAERPPVGEGEALGRVRRSGERLGALPERELARQLRGGGQRDPERARRRQIATIEEAFVPAAARGAEGAGSSDGVARSRLSSAANVSASSTVSATCSRRSAACRRALSEEEGLARARSTRRRAGSSAGLASMTGAITESASEARSRRSSSSAASSRSSAARAAPWESARRRPMAAAAPSTSPPARSSRACAARASSLSGSSATTRP